MNNILEKKEVIKQNISSGYFLQSTEWRKFQEAVERKTHYLENDDFFVSIVEHTLPIVGKYFYVPRGPITSLGSEEFTPQRDKLEAKISNFQFPIKSQISIFNDQIKCGMQELIQLAQKNNAGWIRIEPENEELLKVIKEKMEEIRHRRTEYRIVKAPHDMQPKEVFVIDITKTAEQLLTEMKPKTRYNIGVAKKKNVKVINSEKNKYTQDFLRLTKEMADRQGITAHPEEYYQKMIETLPDEMLKIYVAEFEGEIIAANLILFFGETATYLHGASSNLHRNVMAPFLLQWQQILDAKEKGCMRYDFGGVKTKGANSWEGITSFKFGFSPKTKAIEFPGSYDIIVNYSAYMIYRGLQRAKAFAYRFRK